MCGRAALVLNRGRVQQVAGVQVWRDAVKVESPMYNIAPTSFLPVLIMWKVMCMMDPTAEKEVEQSQSIGKEELVLMSMKWKLRPRWDTTGSTLKMDTINARGEALQSSPLWRRYLPTQRCVILVSGYYEWNRDTAVIQPHYIFCRDESNLLRLAGLCDIFQDANGELGFSFATVTVEAGPSIAHIHHRMPCILPDENSVRIWLNPDSPLDSVLNLVQTYDGPLLTSHRVASYVNSVRNQGPSCIEQIRETKLSAYFRSIDSKKTGVEQNAEDGTDPVGAYGDKIEPKLERIPLPRPNSLLNSWDLDGRDEEHVNGSAVPSVKSASPKSDPSSANILHKPSSPSAAFLNSPSLSPRKAKVISGDEKKKSTPKAKQSPNRSELSLGKRERPLDDYFKKRSKTKSLEAEDEVSYILDDSLDDDADVLEIKALNDEDTNQVCLEAESLAGI